ncbi:hypothetical protein Tco_1313503 [Tanacetum coccineum]
MDDGVVNWGEHIVEEEESNHALMAINSNNEGPQEPKPSVSDDRSSEYSTCQSNDSAGSIGTSSEHSVDLESEISKYLKRENVNSVRPNVNTGRENVNSVRLNVNTGRAPNLPDHNSFSPKRPQVNQLNQRRHFSKSHSPVSRPLVRNTTRMTYSHAVKGNWGTAVKTSAELAIPGKMATGKESSNPFMAGSLPKTIHFYDSLQSDEDSFKLIELMILCTNFLTMVLDLENTKTSQQSDFASLKRSSLGDDASKHGRIDIGDINTDVEITLINENQGRINDIIADEDITLIPKLIIKLLKM